MRQDEFVDRLLISRDQFNKFALIQKQVGINILTPPLSISETKRDRYDHVDAGDGLAHLWLEHKVRNFEFTCREDYPYQTVIVDEAYKIAAKPHPAAIYVIQNRSMTHAAIVYGWTKCNWKQEEFFDRTAMRGGKFYTVPKEMVRFCLAEEAFVCQ